MINPLVDKFDILGR